MDLEPLLRALVAILLSGILGWERESAGKPAGIRTHMLVGLAASLFVLLGELFTLTFPPAPPSCASIRSASSKRWSPA